MKHFELDRVDKNGVVLSTVTVTEDEAKAILTNKSIAKGFAKEARPVGGGKPIVQMQAKASVQDDEDEYPEADEKATPLDEFPKINQPKNPSKHGKIN